MHMRMGTCSCTHTWISSSLTLTCTCANKTKNCMPSGRELVFYQMCFSIHEHGMFLLFILVLFFFNHHFVNRQQGTCFNRFASIFVIIFTAGGLLYFTLWFPLVHCQSIAILLVLYFAMVMKLYACSRICFIDSTSFSIMPSASNYIYFFYSSPLFCMFPPVTSPLLSCMSQKYQNDEGPSLS